MKPLRFLLPAIILTSAVTACTDEATLAVSRADTISFRTAVDSRAQETTASSLNTFAVTATFADDGSTYFNAVPFEAESEGATTFVAGGSPILWPGDRVLTFFAFDGLPDAQTSTPAANGQTMSITFAPAPDASAQTDLIVAAATGQRSDAAIPLSFRHALTQISVAAQSTNEAISYTVRGVRLGGLRASASLTFAPDADNDENPTTLAWSDPTEGEPRSSFSSTFGEDADSRFILTADPLTLGEAFMVIPETAHHPWDGTSAAAADDDGAYIALLLDIRIAGEEGYSGWAAVPVTADWQPGHHYTYTLDLSHGAGRVAPDQTLDGWTAGELILGSDITLSASLSDWTDTDWSYTPPTFDRTDLENLINRPIFFPDQAIAAAQAVLDNTNATDEEVDEAYKKLLDSFQTTRVMLHGQGDENRDNKFLDIDPTREYGIYTEIATEREKSETMVWEISRLTSPAGGEIYYIKNVATGKYLGTTIRNGQIVLTDVPTIIYGLNFGRTTNPLYSKDNSNQIGIRISNSGHYINFRSGSTGFQSYNQFDNGSSFIAESPVIYNGTLKFYKVSDSGDEEEIDLSLPLVVDTYTTPQISVKVFDEDGNESNDTGIDVSLIDAQGNAIDGNFVDGQTITLPTYDAITYSVRVVASSSNDAESVKFPATLLNVNVTPTEEYTRRQPLRDIINRPIFFLEEDLQTARQTLYAERELTDAEISAAVAELRSKFQLTRVLLHGQGGASRGSQFIYASEDGLLMWKNVTSSSAYTYDMVWDITYDPTADKFYLWNPCRGQYIGATLSNGCIVMSDTEVQFDINFDITQDTYSTPMNNVNQIGLDSGVGTGGQTYLNYNNGNKMGKYSFDNGSSFIAIEVPEGVVPSESTDPEESTESTEPTE